MAEKAKLQGYGDAILRIEGFFVDKKGHMRIVDLIRKSGNSMTLVMDENFHGKTWENGLSAGAWLGIKTDPSDDWKSGDLELTLLCRKEGNSYALFFLKLSQHNKRVSVNDISPQDLTLKAGSLTEGKGQPGGRRQPWGNGWKREWMEKSWHVVEMDKDSDHCKQKIQYESDTAVWISSP